MLLRTLHDLEGKRIRAKNWFKMVSFKHEVCGKKISLVNIFNKTFYRLQAGK